MAGETSEAVEALARDLYHAADPTGRWPAADHMTQLYFRRQAARKLQQRAMQELVDEAQRLGLGY